MYKKDESPNIGDPGQPHLALRREILIAYLAPALIAGTAGLATGQPDLLIAAFTSIAATSAAVAGLIGSWLPRHATRGAWLTSTPRVVPTVVFAAGAAALGGAFAGAVIGLTAGGHGQWPDRLWLDLPLSAALAAATTTWRWRGTRRPGGASPGTP